MSDTAERMAADGNVWDDLWAFFDVWDSTSNDTKITIAGIDPRLYAAVMALRWPQVSAADRGERE
jgi:hypothetical protein